MSGHCACADRTMWASSEILDEKVKTQLEEIRRTAMEFQHALNAGPQDLEVKVDGPIVWVKVDSITGIKERKRTGGYVIKIERQYDPEQVFP